MRNIGKAGLFALAAVLTSGLSPAAKAEFFSYTSSLTISDLDPAASTTTPVTGTNVSPGTVTITAPGGTQLALTTNQFGSPAAPLNASGLGTDITFSNLTVIDPVNPNPEFIGFNFTYNLTFTDYPNAAGNSPGGPTTTVAITGRMSGIIGGNQTNLDLLTSAVNPAQFSLGGDLYTLTGLVKAGPGPGSPGALAITVTAAVPEPASIALVGVGGLGLLGVFRRRKQSA